MTIVASITETQFLAQVLEVAALYGWEGVHFRGAWTARGYRTPVQGSLGKGWPDLILIRARDHRLIFAELKVDAGKLTPEQDRVLDFLRSLEWESEHPRDGDTSVAVVVWRPRDFDEIVEALR